MARQRLIVKFIGVAVIKNGDGTELDRFTVESQVAVDSSGRELGEILQDSAGGVGEDLSHHAYRMIKVEHDK